MIPVRHGRSRCWEELCKLKVGKEFSTSNVGKSSSSGKLAANCCFKSVLSLWASPSMYLAAIFEQVHVIIRLYTFHASPAFVGTVRV